jgi:hypothetical protein
MKKISLFFLCLFSLSVLNAQERYVNEVFANVKVTADQTYGVNATVLYIAQLMQAVPEALKLDIYEPEGDTETSRPLVIMFHTGNFVPPQFNGGCTGKTPCKNGLRRRFCRLSPRLGPNQHQPDNEGLYTD